MQRYSNEYIVRQLEKLSIDKIEELSADFSERYPRNAIFQYLCRVAIGNIKDAQRREEFIQAIDDKKNAPNKQ